MAPLVCVSGIFSYKFPLFSVPTGSPTDVRVTVLSESAVSVSWQVSGDSSISDLKGTKRHHNGHMVKKLSKLKKQVKSGLWI